MIISMKVEFLKFPIILCCENKPKYNLELLIEPSYYRSKHQMTNYWFISHTVPNGDELRAKYMQMKDMNEYALNTGLLYRRKLSEKNSLYAYINLVQCILIPKPKD